MKNRQSTSSPLPSDISKETKKQPAAVDTPPQKPVEVGGPKGPEPTRYGDWEKAGRCSDF
ncbi:MAG TPA: succinate dehydrogenase assembly factor 4 [Xanthomonadales bacterium]